MRDFKHIWAAGLAVTLAIIALPLALFLPRATETDKENPWASVPARAPAADHEPLMPGPYEGGPEVTRRCLECHEEAAAQVMDTVHWTWQSEPVWVEGRAEAVAIGKKNALNNFCIGIQSNWPGCTSCHAGYGWEDADFDFTQQTSVDCLVCHDTTGTYAKGTAGLPLEGVDLAEVAQSVGVPTRENCGGCHFAGGGGNGVKHGDLDEHLFNPPESVDVHMGRADFLCIDCHQTEGHQIRGRSISVSLDTSNQVYCTDCHGEGPHADDRLNAHTNSVACQTCHIPAGAVKDPTKMYWDWSTAGLDRPEDPHEYLKIKGSFVYESDFTPEYYWYAGIADRYLIGDTIDPTEPVVMNPPAGDINDPQARIMPFKLHRARQPYDTANNVLLQPKTVGEGGFWQNFDWDQALRLGSEVVGLEYSGSYDFTETWMYWPITHMVTPKGDTLQCSDCHSEGGRLDWSALGYPGDPVEWGGRFSSGRQP
jgi:octaheme c-type cytochrome (tetrathionate reductase family)